MPLLILQCHLSFSKRSCVRYVNATVVCYGFVFIYEHRTIFSSVYFQELYLSMGVHPKDIAGNKDFLLCFINFANDI